MKPIITHECYFGFAKVEVQITKELRLTIHSLWGHSEIFLKNKKLQIKKPDLKLVFVFLEVLSTIGLKSQQAARELKTALVKKQDLGEAEKFPPLAIPLNQL